MCQGLGIMELAVLLISESGRLLAQPRRQKNGAPARLRPANGSPRQAFRLASLSGRISGQYREQGISEVFPQEAGCDPEGRRPLADGRFFAKAGRLGAGER